MRFGHQAAAWISVWQKGVPSGALFFPAGRMFCAGRCLQVLPVIRRYGNVAILHKA